MKIRRNIFEGKEQKVYIHENKKEEYFMVAIPSLQWSTSFSYDENDTEQSIFESLKKLVNENDAAELSSKLYQWTREM